MCSLVMSVHSRDLPINNKLLKYNTLYTAPGFYMVEHQLVIILVC